ncbi:universal stress protein [Streptomyces europaeiscabiei]|uniref:universal stress protein n=1 Tax=Streptomyces europaeiscabiei TaxID=146819 RepID=UPI002E0F023B|nr:universal stress protein [Streptomyces europaeiscabiei]
MSRTVTIGVDGSLESLAAADWAAREALLRGAALRIVYAGEQQPHAYVPFAGEAVAPPGADRSVSMLREVRASLTHRHPGLRITADQVAGQPTTVLSAEAEKAELLVLGSRGLGRTTGLLLGSVALAVVARAARPVVLVRADVDAGDEHLSDVAGIPSAATPYRDVVLGLDLHAPDDTVLGFAFDAALRRGAALRVLHGWNLPGYPPPIPGVPGTRPEGVPAGQTGQRLTDSLGPWREKFPGVEVTEEAVIGRAGSHLVDASRDASLVVVGRRNRHVPVGGHIGPVTHAVLHDAAAPVAVVPHD